jgi:hypothetical protein
MSDLDPLADDSVAEDLVPKIDPPADDSVADDSVPKIDPLVRFPTPKSGLEMLKEAQAPLVRSPTPKSGLEMLKEVQASLVRSPTPKINPLLQKITFPNIKIPNISMPNTPFDKLAEFNQKMEKIGAEQREEQRAEQIAHYASEFCARLNTAIQNFDSELDDSEEVALRLVSFGQSITFHVQSIGYHNPSLIMFYGTGDDGMPLELVQHVSQISFLLMSEKRKSPETPKVPFGFQCGEPEPEPEQDQDQEPEPEQPSI